MTFDTTSLSCNTACFLGREKGFREKRACIVMHVIQADKRHQNYYLLRASETKKRCSYDKNGLKIKEVCSIIFKILRTWKKSRI